MDKSRLVLGTTQLGLRYGLSNTTGQPTKMQAFGILDAAYAGGITILDTAYAYGTAEEIIGEWLTIRGLKNNVRIVSKMKPHVLNEYPDGAKAEKVVITELKKSLKRLQLKKLDGYLLHTPSYIYLAHMVAGLLAAKRKGLVENIGVSVYDEAEALQAAELGVDYVQIPSNVLDQRMDHTDFWSLVRKNHVTVFARSPFLQGLLVMEPKKIPRHLSYARPLVKKFRAIAKANDLTPREAALLFSYVRSNAKHIVFGVETVGQVEENIATVKVAKEARWMKDVEDDFRHIERAVVNPSLWTRIKK